METVGTVDQLSASKRSLYFLFAQYFYCSFNFVSVHFSTKLYTIFFRPKLSYNPSDYETKQVFFNSKDGTKVPMFITTKGNCI